MSLSLSHIKRALEQTLSEYPVTLQVSKTASQLVITIDCPDTETSPELDYSALSDRMMAILLTLDLPDIQHVKFYGRKQSGKPEWQLLRAIAPQKSITMPIPAIGSLPNLSSNDWLTKFHAVKDLLTVGALAGILALLSANTIYGQKPKPVLWEYRIDSIDDRTFTSTINGLGAERWELVFARRAKDSESDRYGYECIFRRQRL
jgi:hypothetical protein